MMEEYQNLPFINSDIMGYIVDYLEGSQVTLHALLSVCKMSRPFAENLLYRNIVISREYDANRVQQLCTTLWNAPALSDLVRTFTCDAFSHEILSLSTDVVTLCENLEEINSFTQATDWTSVLPYKSRLKRIILRRGGILPRKTRQYTLPRLLFSMASCPALESVDIAGPLPMADHKIEDSSKLLSSRDHTHPNHGHSCPMLNTVSILSCKFNDVDIDFLAGLTPHMKVLKVDLAVQRPSEESGALARCLLKWSSSITSLSLHPIHPTPFFETRLDRISMCPLPHLSYLSVNSKLIPAHSLRQHAQLSELHYVVADNDETMPNLVQCILDETFLPKLRVLSVEDINTDLYGPEIKELLKSRSIRLTLQGSEDEFYFEDE